MTSDVVDVGGGGATYQKRHLRGHGCECALAAVKITLYNNHLTVMHPVDVKTLSDNGWMPLFRRVDEARFKCLRRTSLSFRTIADGFPESKIRTKQGNCTKSKLDQAASTLVKFSANKRSRDYDLSTARTRCSSTTRQ
jgi:hypothetical protein